MVSLLSPRTTKSFSAVLLPSLLSPAYTDAWDCSSPDAGLFAFHLVEFPDIPLSWILQPVQVHLNGSTFKWYVNCLSQFCIICKPAEDTFCPKIQVINEDVKTIFTPVLIPGVLHLKKCVQALGALKRISVPPYIFLKSVQPALVVLKKRLIITSLKSEISVATMLLCYEARDVNCMFPTYS